MQTPVMKGKVYLMEAASGDAGFLTVEAVRVLRTAEVVLHDDLVSAKFLDLIPASAQVRNVHRLDAHAGSLRERIHSLLISAAQQGHQVLWLTTNASLPSVEADEAAEALTQAQIDFKVIPGASSAMGAAAGANSR